MKQSRAVNQKMYVNNDEILIEIDMVEKYST
ncbi:hypothetical protein D934_07400 [Xylella fastidiosa subsp. sandyi Ann-1]|uniref:Uncharacterized protein n=1 Tax=Xylella fastidiosa subsp. sandyi Ann-1 TaxID=155920 RepID=A0A060HD24_XYLFS|nr:hypothetical protein D934_07400 [Xylella fastidiosa subsp. sandyi Ann-1]